MRIWNFEIAISWTEPFYPLERWNDEWRMAKKCKGGYSFYYSKNPVWCFIKGILNK